MAPALSIRLDQEKDIWYGGETISGVVIFQSKDKTDITKDVSLNFNGVVKIGVNPRYPSPPPITGYRTTRYGLFEWQQIMCQGPLSLPPGSSYWPFKLQIPMDCNDPWIREGGLPSTARSNSTFPQQPLPPSMNESGPAGECVIKYTLTAVLQTDKFYTKNKEVHQQLIIYPQTQLQSSEFNSTSQPFEVKSSQLNSATKTGGFKLKDRIRSTFDSSTKPTAVFKLVMQLPRYVSHSVNHQGILSVEHDLQASTSKESPVVYLTWIDITMTQQSSVAVTPHYWNTGKPVASWNGKIPLNKSLQLETIMRRIGIPKNTIPSFRVLEVAAVDWLWHFHVKFECAGKELDFRGDIPCIVLSQPWDGIAQVPSAVTAERDPTELVAEGNLAELVAERDPAELATSPTYVSQISSST